MGLGKKRNKRHLNRKSISVIYSTKYLRKNMAAVGYTELLCRGDWECWLGDEVNIHPSVVVNKPLPQRLLFPPAELEQLTPYLSLSVLCDSLRV